jgi:hypothetical protein
VAQNYENWMELNQDSMMDVGGLQMDSLQDLLLMYDL